MQVVHCYTIVNKNQLQKLHKYQKFNRVFNFKMLNYIDLLKECILFSAYANLESCLFSARHTASA